MARNILRDGRLLVPVEVEALEPPPALQRLGGVPGHVRINHQVDVVAYEGADGLYPLLVLAGVRASDLHLHARQTTLQEAFRLREQRLQRLGQVHAGAVGRDLSRIGAQEGIEWFSFADAV